MGKVEEFEGIILSVRHHHENDHLVKIFTDRFGKLMFFSRGTAKRNSKMKTAILPFTKATYIGTINQTGLSFLNDAKDREQYQSMQTDIFLNAYATYLLNLTDAALEDRVPNGTLYHKLAASLREIDEGSDPQIIVNIFEIQLLPYFGVATELRGCSVCGNTEGPFDYSDRYGGLLCREHWQLDEHRYHASQRAIYFLRLFSRVSIDQLGTISVKEETKKEIQHLIDMIYNETVGIKLKSKSFIQKMGQWGDVLKESRNPDNKQKTEASQTDEDKL